MITVGSTRKTEQYHLNGGLTIRQALAKFFNVSPTAVATQLNGQTVRLNAADVNVQTGLDAALRENDVISLYANEVARGGVKGAC